jgi:hypothetical protein
MMRLLTPAPGKIGLADRIGDAPYGLSGHRFDEACNIEPLEAMIAKRDRSLADRSPQ